MTLKIEMPDGKPFDANADTQALNGLPPGSASTARANPMPSIPEPSKERTLMDIAKDIDDAKTRASVASEALEAAEADLARLKAEVRSFGRKPRKAKA